jgi:hypothetical protein
MIGGSGELGVFVIVDNIGTDEEMGQQQDYLQQVYPCH